MHRLFAYIFLGLFIVSVSLSVAQTVPQNVPTNGLVAYYGFSGNADDYSGNGNNGILETAGASQPSLTTDRFGQANRAYQFGGFDNPNWIRVPNSNSLKFSTASTVSFWMMQSSSRGGNPADCSATAVSDGAEFNIISKGGGLECGTQPGIALVSIYSNHSQQFNVYNSNHEFGDVLFYTSKYNCYSNNEWIHVVVTNANSRFRIYINGLLCFSSNMATATFDYGIANVSDFLFGRVAENNPHVTFPFCGKLDDIAIYNRELSREEVVQLYDGYVDDNSSEHAVQIDDVKVVNPCGNNNGTVTITPHAFSGITYKYGRSIDDLSGNNTFSLQPGSYTIYVASSCRQWDTTLTLVCDCADDPTRVNNETVCPGESGKRGNQYEPVCSYSFNTNAEGWNYDGYWAVASGESCYRNIGATISQVQAYTTKSFFCSNLTVDARNARSIPSNTSNLTSPSIAIRYNPSVYPVTLSFYANINGVATGYVGNIYDNLKLYFSTSSSGPWTEIWHGGGGNGYGGWREYTVSLSNYIHQDGTYYFRFVNSGPGYCSAVDNFKITADTRWEIPREVTYAPGGSTVKTEKIVSSAGACPVTDVTFWYIAPLGDGHDTTAGCDTTYFNNRMFFSDTLFKKTGFKTTFGCDSAHTDHIIVFHSDKANITTEEVCDQYIWPVDGVTYTFDTIVGYNDVNDYGCLSMDSLFLTVHYSFDSVIYDSIDQRNLPYIAFNGESYDYELRNELFHYTTVDNCDSNYHLTIRLIFSIAECDSFLQFPNVVTPNGDGHNDIFTIVGIDRGCYQHNKLIVYNRWGAVVHRAKDIISASDGWDPRHMPAGTYYFYFTADGSTGRVVRRGVIEVLK